MCLVYIDTLAIYCGIVHTLFIWLISNHTEVQNDSVIKPHSVESRRSQKRTGQTAQDQTDRLRSIKRSAVSAAMSAKSRFVL